MKNVSKQNWLSFFKFFLLLTGFMSALYGFFIPPEEYTSCNPPDVSIVAQHYNSVSFAWNPVLGAGGYKVRYYRVEDQFSSGQSFTEHNNITYSSLPAGAYIFYFSTLCGGEISAEIIVDDLIMGLQ